MLFTRTMEMVINLDSEYYRFMNTIKMSMIVCTLSPCQVPYTIKSNIVSCMDRHKHTMSCTHIHDYNMKALKCKTLGAELAMNTHCTHLIEIHKVWIG